MKTQQNLQLEPNKELEVLQSFFRDKSRVRSRVEPSDRFNYSALTSLTTRKMGSCRKKNRGTHWQVKLEEANLRDSNKDLESQKFSKNFCLFFSRSKWDQKKSSCNFDRYQTCLLLEVRSLYLCRIKKTLTFYVVLAYFIACYTTVGRQSLITYITPPEY